MVRCSAARQRGRLRQRNNIVVTASPPDAGIKFTMPKVHRKVSSGRARTPRAIAQGRYQLTKLKARELPIPRLISEAHFEELCRPYHFSVADRRQLLGEINGILKDMGKWMRENPPQPISKQRDCLRAAAAHIKKARELLNERADRFHLGFTAEPLAPMLSASWLREQFPTDELAPRAIGLAPFVDDGTSRLQRKRFFEHRPVEAITAILDTIEAAFAHTLMMLGYIPGGKGGPKPLQERRTFIVMLAIKWERLGKRTSTSPTSDFVAFIDNIMDAIGWPSDLNNEGGAVVAAVGDAVKHWRNLASK